MIRMIAGSFVGLLAQIWLATGALAAPGDHIRAGDVELVPDIDLGGEFRTNVYRSEVDAVPAANFRIAPGLLVAAEGDDHDFRLGGEWVLRKYFFVGDNDAVFYSSPSCTGPQWLLMQGTQSYPILHNISSNGVKSWNNLIQCAEVGKNAEVTICSVQSYKGKCLTLTAGVHSLAGTGLAKEVSSIRKDR